MAVIRERMGRMIRLDKYLADGGFGTRREVRQLIRSGRVSVGGRTVKKADLKINETADLVFLDGEAVTSSRWEYYMLNKPAGVVSATEDPKDKTVIDLIGGRKRRDLFPVGRLDKDTEGLLLITNDGELAHRLLSPKKHVDKVYYAEVRGCVAEETRELFAAGIDIGTKDPELTMPAVLEILEKGEVSRVRLTIQEGKYHQVKRMFSALGMEVLYLKRVAMGPLRLDEKLPAGEYRPLTEEELERIR